MEGEETSLAIELVQRGRETAGGAVDAALGLIGDPPAAGVDATRAIKRLAADFRRGPLSPREEIRVGAAAAEAVATIAGLLGVGLEPRDDGFFESTQAGQRPAAEEFLEEILLQARDADEEQKVRHLGKLYAFVAFRQDLSVATANHLLEVASQLTYRQFLILAIAARNDVRPVLGETDVRANEEIDYLYQRGLITGVGSGSDLLPAEIRPQELGGLLVAALGLATIPPGDLEPIINQFR